MHSDDKKNLSLIFKGSGIILAGTIIAQILGLLFHVLLGRYLGPEKYGYFNLGKSVIQVLGVFVAFGLPGALPRMIPYHISRGDESKVEAIVSFSLKFSLILSLLLSALLLFLSGIISNNIFHKSALSPVLIVFALAFPFRQWGKYFYAFIRSFKKPLYKAIFQDIALPLAKILLFLVGLSFFADTLSSAISAFFISEVSIAILMGFFVHKYVVPLRLNPRASTPVAKELLIFSWPLFSTGFVYLLLSRIDIFSIGYFLPGKDLGVYAAALKIAVIVNLAGMAFQYMFLPVISELYGKNNKISGMFLQEAVKWSSVLVLPVLIIILLSSTQIMTIVFGKDYSEGALPLAILAVGFSINVLAGPTGNVLIASGHTIMNFFSESIPAIMNVFLNILLIPKYGIVGAATATASSFVVRKALSVSFVYYTSRAFPFNGEFAKLLCASVFCFLVSYALTRYGVSFASDYISLLRNVLVVVVLYLFSISLVIKEVRSRVFRYIHAISGRR